MDRRRQELVRLLERRRRRVRLLLVCAATALACGAVAGMAAPQWLIGGVSQAVAPAEPANGARPQARPAQTVAGPLDLADRLGLDPREEQANAIRWASLSQAERRAFLDRYWRLAEMESVVLDRAIEKYAAFRDLPAKRQEFLKTHAQKLRAFMKTLSPQDQAVIESLPEAERAQRLLQLWQVRYGTW